MYVRITDLLVGRSILVHATVTGAGGWFDHENQRSFLSATECAGLMYGGQAFSYTAPDRGDKRPPLARTAYMQLTEELAREQGFALPEKPLLPRERVLIATHL